MPQLPVTVNANITRIDAPFPENWREDLNQFAQEIAGIKELMGVIATSLTQSSEAQEVLSKLYTQESVAERASQAIAAEQSQHRPTNPNGEEPFVSRQPETSPEQEQRKEEKQEPSTAPDSMPAILSKEIDMPQHYGGKYTTQDLLSLAGKAALWNKPFGIGSQQGAAKKLGEAAEFQPNLEAASNLAKTYIGGGLSSARNQSEQFGSYSGSLGYEAGNGFLGSNSVSGPLGTNFRVPLLNSPALSGLAQTSEAYMEALTIPGVSGPQAMAMNQSLAERGWFPGTQGRNELFDTQGALLGKGGVVQQLGEDPEVSNLIDHAMRSGTAGSQEMIRTIEEIPSAAKSAHEGVSQMVQSMNELGEFSQSQGGTHYAGQQQALELAQSTGLPVQATKGLVESPWGQSAIFRSTGTPSWMQGTVPGAIKNQAAMQGFWSLSRAVGKGEGKTYKSGGFEEYVSPIEEQAARMHMLLPNMSPESIQKMLREGKRGTEGRTEVQKQAEMWEKTARGVMGTGHENYENQLLTASNIGGHNFGRLMKNMLEQKTEDGRPMFSNEDIKDIRTNYGEGYESHGKQLVEEKYSNIQKILNTKAGKDANAAGSPGKVMLELSPEANRLVRFSNKRSRISAEAGAGENSNVNAFSGYSDGPEMRPFGSGVANRGG